MMNSKLIAGVLAASLWGGVVLADEYNRPSQPMTAPSATQSQQDLNNPSLMPPPAQVAPQQDVNINLPPDTVALKKDDNKNHLRGFSVLAGAGIEGYTGALADQLRPGPTWGVNAAVNPSKVFGIELGYSGAANEVGSGRASYFSGYSGGIARGADIVRNGGHAMATLGLTASAVQPYITGGLGVDRYDVRGAAANFRSDTVGSIPVGAGLRAHIRNFTADARIGTSVLFNNQFASDVSDRNIVGVNSINATRYQGTLSLGSSF